MDLAMPVKAWYSGGREFEPDSYTNILTGFFFVVFLSHSRRMLGWYFKIVHDRLLLSFFSFINSHRQCRYHRRGFVDSLLARVRILVR